MSKPFNQHSNFFSSLKQVEKRLKLEENSSQSCPTKEIHTTSEESLSSPIYLHNSTEPHNHNLNCNHNTANICSNDEDSEVAHEFLSNSMGFTPTQQEKSLLEEAPLLNPPKTLEDEFNCDGEVDVDEIGSLIELLGLSEIKGNESNLELESCSSCHCDSGFLGKIAGVKGPKCKKERERLEGWISHFRNENVEPLRLAHLLLGKAAVLYGNGGDGGGGDEGYEGLEFPSTVDEFLRHDPPSA